MGIHIRPRDKVSTRASGEMRARTARQVVETVAAATTELQTVMGRDPRYPADPRDALAAVAAFRRRQDEIDAAVGEMLAWLQVGGITRSAMARALGVRPATIQRMLAPHETTAGARHVDLSRAEDGTWAAQRRPERLSEEIGDDPELVEPGGAYAHARELAHSVCENVR